MLLKILNNCTPVKYTLFPGAKKLDDLVEAIFVHGLIERVNFWFNLSRTMIEPRVADYIIPERV